MNAGTVVGFFAEGSTEIRGTWPRFFKGYFASKKLSIWNFPLCCVPICSSPFFISLSSLPSASLHTSSPFFFRSMFRLLGQQSSNHKSFCHVDDADMRTTCIKLSRVSRKTSYIIHQDFRNDEQKQNKNMSAHGRQSRVSLFFLSFFRPAKRALIHCLLFA